MQNNANIKESLTRNLKQKKYVFYTITNSNSVSGRGKTVSRDMKNRWCTC